MLRNGTTVVAGGGPLVPKTLGTPALNAATLAVTADIAADAVPGSLRIAGTGIANIGLDWFADLRVRSRAPTP